VVPRPEYCDYLEVQGSHKTHADYTQTTRGYPIKVSIFKKLQFGDSARNFSSIPEDIVNLETLPDSIADEPSHAATP
jgi:hypothetical protein